MLLALYYTTLKTRKSFPQKTKTEFGAMEEENGLKTYCVTGATGYIGSWLVKSLLQRGFKVHATLRNLENASHFIKSWEGGDRLSLFKADLLDDGSFDEAIRGCAGVYHVAASMEFGVPATENLDSYIKNEIMDPAIKGVMNILTSCLKTDTVKRIVFTSSVSTLTAKDSSGGWKSKVDESCQTSVKQVLETKANGWVYVLSKLLTEETAFQFAKENGIDLVSVITTTVGGSFLTPTVPGSIRIILSPVTGDPKLLPILEAVNSRMGSIALVHIVDVCNAHMFLMEHPKAVGRYLCCTNSCAMSELVEHLTREYSCADTQRRFDKKQHHDSVPAEISSKKLRDLGFSYNYSVEEIIQHTVRICEDYGFLPVI